MNKFQQLLRAVLPLMVLIAAGAVAKHLIDSRPAPKQKAVEDRGMLVEATRVRAASHPVVVNAKGTVVAAYSVELSAEVTGRVIWKNPELTTGGLVKKGEPLVKIDPRDYRIALEQQQAAVARAEAEMELELGRGTVAEQEWNLFGAESGQANPDLALRKPQRRSAELGLETAKSSRQSAKLRLDRTVLRAPFNAVVRQNLTEPGRLVSPGAVLASLVQTDIFMVVVSLPVEDLSWLKIPGVNVPNMTQKEIDAAMAAEDRQAAFAELTTLARVRQTTGRGDIERSGVVTRILGDLDPVGRMARMLVAIRDPMGREASTPKDGVNGLPLLLGAYVSVDLLGQTIDDAIEIPRLALRDGDRVYLVGAGKKLEVREVNVVRRRDDTVLIRGGLAPGDQLITSTMPSVVPGMRLRIRGETELNPSARAASTASTASTGGKPEAATGAASTVQ